MKFKKVITHDTTFHADDVFAVAMLGMVNPNFELIRTRDSEILAAGMADPLAVVLDVGGVYNPQMLNFDHHQDVELMSAAGLIFEHFKSDICPEEAQPFFAEFVRAIDLIDTNRGNIYATWDLLPTGFRNVSSIIGGFNRDVTDAQSQFNRFGQALVFACVIIGNEIFAAQAKATFEAEYAQREVLPNNVAVFNTFFRNWKEKKDHVFAVMPHANGWQIQSRDTTIDKVPERIADLPGFVFRHGSGFMAVVKDREVAVEFARIL